MPEAWGDNLSNNDFDPVSRSLKYKKVSFQKWDTKHPPIGIRGAPKEWVELRGEPSLERHTERVLDDSLNWVWSLWEPILFSSFSGSKLSMTLLVYQFFSGWQAEVRKCNFKSTVKPGRRQGIFWERKKVLVISTRPNNQIKTDFYQCLFEHIFNLSQKQTSFLIPNIIYIIGQVLYWQWTKVSYIKCMASQ